jgi:hypothetical protein
MLKKLLYLTSIALIVAMSAGSLWADTIWEGQIMDDNDDVEQQGSSMSMTSSDLEFMGDGNTEVGMRFIDVTVPKGSAVSKAYIEFQVDELESDTPANLIIYGEKSGNASEFASTSNNVTNRPLTNARVFWSPEHYPTVGDKVQTVDISAIIEEIVSQQGWAPGNALVIIVIEDPDNGTTGFRTVEAGPGDDSSLLHIEYGPRVKAGVPTPASGVTEVSRDTILAWKPGVYVNTHNVHLGTAADALAEVSTGQTATSYDPGRLDFGQTYFWRVDEVNGAPDRTVFEGELWDFTVELFSYPIENVTVTASSAHDGDMGPEKTIDGSGINEMDQHATEPTAMWLSGMGDAAPSIQYDFDKAYKLDAMWVWNSNQMVESFVGLGAKDVTIEYSVDGVEWTVLESVTQLAQATGTEDYKANTIADFAGAMAKHVRITIASGYGFLPQYGLSEVRFLYIPVSAREPMPADGSTVDSTTVELAWRAGREAASSEVYLGTDPNALDMVGTSTDSSYTASGLDYSTTYYWSVTEVNEAEAVPAYAGDLWSLTTPAFDTVEDFDQYNDACDRIFFAWQDGIGHNGGTDIDNCDVPAYNGNGGGSIVGNDIAPFAEQAIVTAGSSQSMPFNFDNSFGPSEAKLALSGQDWSASGATALSIAFYGAAGNTGTLYVKINNAKVTNDGTTSSLALAGWQIWNIDLAAVSGIQNVTSLSIGVDGGSASGMLYIDDIRLYPEIPAPINEWRVSASTDDAEEHDRDFGVMEGLGSSDLELPYEQSITDAGHQMVGCRWPGIPVPRGATITEAWVQFSADSVGGAGQDDPVSLVIHGQLAPDGETFTSDAANISTRPKTTASVVWDVPVWTETHLMGPGERTPDISSIIQEIVNQADWAGEAIVLIFSDNPDNPSVGYREPESADGTASEAPLLHILYE